MADGGRDYGINFHLAEENRNVQISGSARDTLGWDAAPHGASDLELYLSSAYPTTVGELTQIFTSSKRPPFAGFPSRPMVALTGIVVAHFPNSSITLSNGGLDQATCQVWDTFIGDIPNGAKIRILGVAVYRADQAPGERLTLYYCRIDPTFKIVTNETETLGDDARQIMLQELGKPIERKAPKKVTLKEKKEYGDLILQSAKSGDWETLKEAVTEGGLINTANDFDGANALTYVLWAKKMPKEQRRELVQLLVEYGVRMPDDTKTESSVATLPLAVYSDDVEIVRLLLRAGANPKIFLSRIGTDSSGAPTVGKEDALSIARQFDRNDIATVISLSIQVTGGEPIGENFAQQSAGFIQRQHSGPNVTVNQTINQSVAVNQTSNQTINQSSSTANTVNVTVNQAVVNGSNRGSATNGTHTESTWDKSSPAYLYQGKIVRITWANAKFKQGLRESLQGNGTLVLLEKIKLIVPQGASFLIPGPAGKIGPEDIDLARWVEGKIAYVKYNANGARAQKLLPMSQTQIEGGVQVDALPLASGDYALATPGGVIAFHVE
jgi:hypothetical protein